VYLGSFAQNDPEVFEGIYQETDKMEPGIAALAGGLSSVLDALGLETLGHSSAFKALALTFSVE